MKKILFTAMIAAMSLTGAQACSIDANKWTQNGGSAAVSVTGNESRYEGLCSLKVSADGDYVEHTFGQNDAAGDDIFLRFYAHVSADQTDATIFDLVDSSGDSVLNGKLDGGNLVVGDASVAFPANTWNFVQIRASSTGITLWVGQDDDRNQSNGGVMASAPAGLKLGGIANFAGTMFVDSVIVANADASAANSGAPMENAVQLAGGGPILVPGDANGDSGITAADIVSVNEEIFGQFFGFAGKEEYLKGVPDRTLDGSVTAADIVAINDKIFSDLFGGN